MASINPYVNFNGNCEQAFDFYKSVFGGEYISVMRFSEMPSEHPVPQEYQNRILHVCLPVSDGYNLMGSDTAPMFGGDTKPGTNFQILINADTREEADKLFAGLSEGGHAFMPMADAFWGAYFGQFTDKFGIGWMISFEKK